MLENPLYHNDKEAFAPLFHSYLVLWLHVWQQSISHIISPFRLFLETKIYSL